MATDYLGYKLSDPAGSTRLEGQHKEVDILYVADTYGVYRNDLASGSDVRRGRPGPLIFGGLTAESLRVIDEVIARRRSVVFEFDSVLAPTSDKVRTRIEQLIGLRFTGWAGRFIPNLHDAEDAPYWLADRYRQQYGRSLPRGSALLLVHRHGSVHLFSGSRFDVAPKVFLTGAGRNAVPGARNNVSYYSWFAIMEPLDDNAVDVWAELRFHRAVRAAIPQLPARIVAATKRRTSRAYFFAGDFSDVNFELGNYGRIGLIKQRAAATFARPRSDASSVYWGIFVPMVRAVVVAQARSTLLSRLRSHRGHRQVEAQRSPQ